MAEKKRVLVSEDEPGLLDLIKMTLAYAGYEVHSAEDGQQALELLDEIPRPDLIVTDVMMPRLDGYHLAQAVAEKFGADCPPILIMTSRDTEREKGVALLSGATDVIQKPFEIFAFMDKIRDLLNEPSAQSAKAADKPKADA